METAVGRLMRKVVRAVKRLRLPRGPVKCACRGKSVYTPGFMVCELYECSRCKRNIPWCIGGSDSEVCDDCWCQITHDGTRDVPLRWLWLDGLHAPSTPRTQQGGPDDR